jgi:DNA relaxase NicK
MAADAPKSLLNPEDYFRGVSPMCRRLLEDMAAVRESMGQDWTALTYEQQCKILDQAIVDEV